LKTLIRFVHPSQLAVGAACGGIAAANLVRVHWFGLAGVVVGSSVLLAIARPEHRLAVLVAAFALAGWWWGSERLDAIDRSPLSRLLGTAEDATVVVTAPPRRSSFSVRANGEVRRFGRFHVSEPVLLEFEAGRSPAQGDVLDVLGVLAPPRGPENGFDERTYLRRHGIHVVLRVDRWHATGRRGGLGGVADSLREFVTRGLSRGARGEHRAVLLGVVLGADEGLTQTLRDRFRASGLYHLLAVSGQNVALVAGGALLLAWLAGIPRLLGELGALAAIAAYVLAVGAQPSVVRAGIAGALGSISWLLARERDRWWFLLVGALLLLAWNPYALLDAGFQLSFAAVIAIFLLAPRLGRVLEGYPFPQQAAGFLAISTACGLATAPILWLQFHAVPLLAVPANALAAPVVGPMLDLALTAAAVHPIAPSAAATLTWLAGWCAAYLAFCARLIGSLPFAQITSGWAAAGIGLGAALVGTYAWRRCRSRS
jgi:ComEC/Rec2-related protein